MEEPRRKKGPPKKDPDELLRRIVHVTLNDRDYLAVLEKTAELNLDVSAYVRKLIKRDLYGTELG